MRGSGSSHLFFGSDDASSAIPTNVRLEDEPCRFLRPHLKTSPRDPLAVEFKTLYTTLLRESAAGQKFWQIGGVKNI